MREQKVEGGYVLMPVWQICAVWTAYTHGVIQLRDFRVWLACHEKKARRSAAGEGRKIRFSIEELHRLVGGVGGEHLRSSVRRLERANLLKWSEAAIDFPSDADLLSCDLRTSTLAMLASIQNNERLLPMPRRMLRVLAAGGTKAVIATALGHLLRCLYLRRNQVNARGACKASWVAEVFGLADRNIKAARNHLLRLGWLQSRKSPQWHLNRYGLTVEVNLSWSPPATKPMRTSPPEAFSTTSSSPPDSDKQLLTKYKNQKPASSGPAGFLKVTRLERPVLRNIVRADLHSPGRLLELFRQAVGTGVVRDSEHERLQFLAAAEHAQAVGTRNPCGLFSYLIRHNRWDFATQADEDRARRRFMRHDESGAGQGSPARFAPKRIGSLTRIGATMRDVLAHLETRGTVALRSQG